MSILIRGMKMPKNCGECPMICDYDLSREARGKEKAENCPLIELPPHGRLIDADALHIQLIDKELDQLQPWTLFDDCREVVQMIDDAPTIIEGEEEE